MSRNDEMPSLAGLRRGRGRRPPASTPSLFEATLAEMSTVPTKSTEETPPLQVEPKVWSVSTLVQSVRGLVERSYGQIWVEGEVSNWRPAASGHCYFTLKDGEAQLSVVMFRRQAGLLRFKPKDGLAVRLRGQLSVYESRGQMQLIAETMEQVGLGALLAAVRALKERLQQEGLFERKRPLPAFPQCIGVVTSAQGAALRDIVKVCRRRHAAVRLLVYPAAVQGPSCAAEVAAGVRWFSAHPEQADVVIVARGGGSWEDLHGFDAEVVVRAIAACEVPVITGIGHATDTTLADAAADVCAPTPSAAAELVTAAQHGIAERVQRLRVRLERSGRFELLRASQRLARLDAARALGRVIDGIGRREQRLDDLGYRAETSAVRLLRVRAEQLRSLDGRLRQQHVAFRLPQVREQLYRLRSRLEATRGSATLRARARLEQATTQLEALSPLRVLERGYALVYGPAGKLLRDAADVRQGDAVTAQLARGRVSATVTSKA